MNNLALVDEIGDCSIKQEQNDSKIYLFVMLRRKMREGRLTVIREEERVQRCEGNERRERW